MNPDRLAHLEEERRFLLASLRDLEREHDAGDVSDEDYAALKDGYTVRAAAVLRELEEGQAALAPRRSRRRGVVVASVLGIVVLAVAAGWFVARQSGERLPGQFASGNVAAESVSGLLSRARAQLNPADPGPALDLYARVLELEPDNVEALTYIGWLSVLSATQDSDPDRQAERFESGLVLLRQATIQDPTYADAHCFLAIAFFRFLGDAEAAQPEVEACVAADPPAEVAGLVSGLAAEIDAALG